MALRTTVSRIAARGTVTTPPAETNPLDTDQPELPPEEETSEPEEEQERNAALAERMTERSENSAAAEPTKRRGRPPVDRARAKKSLQTTPIATGMETVPELRAKIKDVEQLIKEARVRHDTEMRALKTTYADLHAVMFSHIK